jgi:5-methylthioribose kinase
MLKFKVCIFNENKKKTELFFYLDKTKNEIFILMEKRVSELYKKADSYQVLETYVNLE